MDQYSTKSALMGQSGNYVAQALAGSPSEARDANVLEALLSRLHNIRERLVLLVDREQRIITRAYGPTPEAANGQVRPEPSGMISLLQSSVEDIEQLTEAAHQVLGRIDSII